MSERSGFYQRNLYKSKNRIPDTFLEGSSYSSFSDETNKLGLNVKTLVQKLQAGSYMEFFKKSSSKLSVLSGKNPYIGISANEENLSHIMKAIYYIRTTIIDLCERIVLWSSCRFMIPQIQDPKRYLRRNYDGPSHSILINKFVRIDMDEPRNSSIEVNNISLVLPPQELNKSLGILEDKGNNSLLEVEKSEINQSDIHANKSFGYNSKRIVDKTEENDEFASDLVNDSTIKDQNVSNATTSLNITQKIGTKQKLISLKKPHGKHKYNVTFEETDTRSKVDPDANDDEDDKYHKSAEQSRIKTTAQKDQSTSASVQKRTIKWRKGKVIITKHTNNKTLEEDINSSNITASIIFTPTYIYTQTPAPTKNEDDNDPFDDNSFDKYPKSDKEKVKKPSKEDKKIEQMKKEIDNDIIKESDIVQPSPTEEVYDMPQSSSIHNYDKPFPIFLPVLIITISTFTLIYALITKRKTSPGQSQRRRRDIYMRNEDDDESKPVLPRNQIV